MIHVLGLGPVHVKLFIKHQACLTCRWQMEGGFNGLFKPLNECMPITGVCEKMNSFVVS
jgi:hypothetical protein